MNPTTSSIFVETIVLGAGPGGLQVAWALARAGRPYLVLDAANRPGSTFRQFPRHRKLLSINKVHTGTDDPELQLRWDWNSLIGGPNAPRFGDYTRDYFPSADVLPQYLEDYAEHENLRVSFGMRVTGIRREQGRFVLSTGVGARYECDRLIVASGLCKPHVPDVPGMELTQCYTDMSIDADDYAGQRVLVIGKGNSGFETADHLTPTAAMIHIVSPEPLQLAWQTHYVGHLRAVNNNFLDTYQLKSQNAVLDAQIRGIQKTPAGTYTVNLDYAHADAETETIEYDRVLRCTGFTFDDSLFDASCRPQRTACGKLPKQTSEWESVNVPGLFFAGTLMAARDHKKSASPFIHGFRYGCVALVHMLERRLFGTPWPHRVVPRTAEALSAAALARANRSSGLWQMFGFLCDVIELDSSGDAVRVYEDVPIDYVQDGRLGVDRFVTMSLEFGPKHANPFAVNRHPKPARAASSSLLHPVFRHYKRGEQRGELHLLEDLFAEWKKPDSHIVPLRAFVDHVLDDTQDDTHTASPSVVTSTSPHQSTNRVDPGLHS